MLSKKEIAELIKKFQENLQKIISIKTEELVRERELGTDMNFKEGVPLFERIINYYSLFENIDLNVVNPTQIDSLNTHVAGTLTIFDKIKGFTISGVPNPKSVRDALLGEIERDYNSKFLANLPFLALRAPDTSTIKSLEKEMRHLSQDASKQRDQMVTNMEDQLKDSQSIVTSMRAAASEAGVSAHAEIFSEASRKYSRASWVWLAALGVAFVLTIIFVSISFNVFGTQDSNSNIPTGGVGFIQDSSATSDSVLLASAYVDSSKMTAVVAEINTGDIRSWWADPAKIEHLIGRFVILSLLLYAISFTGRNYNSMRHNLIVNEHRANSMRTFQAFVEAAGEDAETKNAVLIQATQSIFSAQASGYSHKESNPEPQPKIIEILSSLGRTGSKVT